jgi:glycosyl transferase family 87
MHARPLDLLRRADWLTRDRIVAWGSVMFIMELLVLVFLALWQHGLFISDVHSPASDFASFYAAGKLALAGTPQLAYDQAAHYIAQQQATGTHAPHQFFFYPPVYLLLCAPLATLPYLAAFAVFQVATLALFIATMRSLLRERGADWLLPLLAFPAVFWTIALGQNAFLNAALFCGFALLLQRRPFSAGMLLGCLCYKPHFGLLVPVALLAARRWRALAGAAGVVVGLVGASVALFGWGSWIAYLAALSQSDQVYATGAIDFAGIITPFGAARLLGIQPNVAYALQAAITVVMVVLVAAVWLRAVNHNLRVATLLVATLLAVPLALLYDQLLLLVAIGWLLREARQTGLLTWERIVLLAIYPLALVSLPLGQATHVPLGFAVSVAVFGLCLRRAWSALTADRAYAAPLGATS